ncbi:MAG: DUF4350 domain-containing protein [Candidatus Thiodiazotropha sp. (ex Gloverina cf. vestifex)]|nr:DUF4350 domain-containing protein [Candidatus Thiodiazotropha sp. (ex Gloverina cf. vestifex)]
MTSNRVAVAAVLLLLLFIFGSIGYWFWANFERVSKEVRTDMSAEARRNPWLAAERLLDRLGMQVESRSGRHYLTLPPDEIGALFVKDLGAPLPQARQTDLLNWVESGGHLVVSPGRLIDDETNHPLLEYFGIELSSTETESDDTEDARVIALPGNDEELTIEFDPDRWFLVESDYEYWKTPADDFPNLLIFSWGEGWITFLTDNRYWDNSRIGDSDNALLLARLTADYDQAWLLYSTQMPSLLRLLWQWAPYLIASLTVLILLMLWRMTEQIGPRRFLAYSQRRNLLEHLKAASEYAWRTDPATGLLEGARRQVEKRWLASHPLLLRLEPPARCQWLAERTGLTPQSIEQALYGCEGESGQLIKTTVNLQRLLSALHPQTKKR